MLTRISAPGYKLLLLSFKTQNLNPSLEHHRDYFGGVIILISSWLCGLKHLNKNTPVFYCQDRFKVSVSTRRWVKYNKVQRGVFDPK